jgi:membrane protease subunit (stomatin/prohibitin family)
MPYCDNCGQQIDEKQKFCPNCGARNEAAFKAQGASMPPPPPPPAKEVKANLPPPPPHGHKSNVPPPKKLIDLEIDQKDVDEGVEKAKRGLSAAFGFAKKGLSKGAEMAGKGIDAARETIDERRSQQAQQPSAPPTEGQKVCPNCGEAVTGSGKFCNHCGQRLE